MEFSYEYIDEKLLNITDSDTANSKPLVAGGANFLIKRVLVTEKNGQPLYTKDGSPKFKIVHTVEDCQGNIGTIWKDISAKMQKVIYDLGASVGVNIYQKSGKFDPEVLQGYSGKCELKMQISSDPAYDDKIVIDKYLKKEDIRDSIPGANKFDSNLNVLDDDDIPF